MPDQIIMIGAGGHARVLLASLRARGVTVSACIARDKPDAKWPAAIRWLGGDDALSSISTDSVRLVNGIGSVGSTAVRWAAYEKIRALGFLFASVIHPSAVISGDVKLGEGCQIMAGAVIQTGTTLGDNTIVNTRAAVDHDCDIGAHSHVATGAALSGDVTLGQGVHIGTGSAVMQGVRIGAGSVIGAGAAVLKDIPEAVMAAGIPARVIKPALSRLQSS